MAIVQQGTQGLLQARISQAHPKNDRVKRGYLFFWVFFWGRVLLWFSKPVVYEQSWTATAFPAALWMLALEPSLGDSTQLILLQCLLTNSLCNSWASLLFNAGFLMEQSHTQHNPKLPRAVKQGIVTTGRIAGNHSFKPETLVLILHWKNSEKEQQPPLRMITFAFFSQIESF